MPRPPNPAIWRWPAYAGLPPTRAAELEPFGPAVHRLFDTGVEMAGRYLRQGRQAGKPLMKRPGGFDEQAGALAAQIDTVVAGLGIRSADRLEEATDSLAWMRTLTSRVGAGMLLATALAAVIAQRMNLRPQLRRRDSAVDLARLDETRRRGKRFAWRVDQVAHQRRFL